MRTQPNTILDYFFVFLLAVVPFLPSVPHGATNWDDNIYITDNPLIKESTHETWKSIFTDTYANFYHPFTLLSHKLDHLVFARATSGPHAVNIFLHALNAMLFLYLCQRWTGRRGLSVWITLLFALHPLRTEVVCWLSERKELLCTTFSLLALCVYRPPTQRAAFPFGAFFFFLCALLSKSMAVTLPFVLLLVDVFESPHRVSRRGIVEKIPFLLASLFFVFVTYRAQWTGGATVSVWEQPWIWNTLSMAYSCGFYIWKTLVPLNLSPFYALNQHAPQSQGFLLCFLFPVFLLLGLLLWRRQKDGHMLFGLLFYFITLLPVAGLIRFGPVLVADRFSYFPSMGLSLALGWGIFLLLERRRFFYRLSRYVAILVLVAFGFLISLQSRTWKSSFHLWTAVLEKDATCGMAWTNLCAALVQSWDLEQADRFCSRALYLNPQDFKALLNRGMASLLGGRLGRASSDFERAEKIAPEDLSVIYAVGLLKAQQGDVKTAIRVFERVLSVSPCHKEAAGMLGILFHQQGDAPHARAHLEDAVRWGSREEEVYKTLLDTYVAEKNMADALSLCHGWLPWATDKKAIVRKVCLLYLWQGSTDQARECFDNLQRGCKP